MLAAASDKDVRWWVIDSLGILDTAEALSILEERLANEANENLKPFMIVGPKFHAEVGEK